MKEQQQKHMILSIETIQNRSCSPSKSCMSHHVLNLEAMHTSGFPARTISTADRQSLWQARRVGNSERVSFLGAQNQITSKDLSYKCTGNSKRKEQGRRPVGVRRPAEWRFESFSLSPLRNLTAALFFRSTTAAGAPVVVCLCTCHDKL